MIRVRSLFFFDKELPIHTMGNKQNFVGLRLFCTDACDTLVRGLDGNGSSELGESVQKDIEQLTTWAEPAMRTLNGSLTKVSITELWKGSITSQRQDLVGVLCVFNVRLVGFVWYSLTASFQSELPINSRVAAEKVH